MKGLCTTRWESRIECIKLFRFKASQLGEAFDALIDYAQERKDSITLSEAVSLKKEINTWPFFVSTVVWYDVLFVVNKTSKLMQQTSISLDVLQREIGSTLDFLRQYRNQGFETAKKAATTIAEGLMVECVFPARRSRKHKKMFDYESEDSGMMDPEHQFKCEFFYPLLDQVISSVEERFAQIVDLSKRLGFLFNIESMKVAITNEDDLCQKCISLEQEMGDVDALELVGEVVRFTKACPMDVNTPLQCLNYIYKENLHSIYPNLSIGLRVLLTIPVSVASGERSFSKLKLVKTYLRSTMCQDRLNGLAIISIENETARNIEYNLLIDKFASKKSRKVIL